MKVDNPETFAKEKEKLMQNRKKRLEEIIVEETPVYFDPKTKKYYYPKLSLEEPDLRQRRILVGKPSADPENYGRFESPAEFHQRRTTVRAKLLQDEIITQARDTPIYQDPQTSKYYYPLIATREAKVVKREVRIEIPNFTLDEVTNMLYDPETDESYFACGSPEEFDQIRNGFISRLKEKKRLKQAQESVICFDSIAKKFYYPESVLNEKTFLFHPVVNDKNGLFYDLITKTWTHIITGKARLQNSAQYHKINFH